MDFEIDDDGDEYNYEYDAGDDHVPSKPSKKSSFFGAEDEGDEGVYDFSYQKEGQKNTKQESSRIATFSPRLENPKSLSAPDAQPESAMERAQNMLSKYSNKNFGAPASNFRTAKARTFNEDDISLSSNDDASDFEMSAYNEDKKPKPSSKGRRPDINTLRSKTTVMVSMGDGDEEDEEDLDGLDAQKSLENTRFNDEEDGAGGENEYSEDPFDQEDEDREVTEIGESAHLSQTVESVPESGSPMPGEISRDNADEEAEEVDASYGGRENASFSRLAYDNDDDADSVDNENDSPEKAFNNVEKPNILSFADLVSQKSWDADADVDAEGGAEADEGDEEDEEDEYPTIPAVPAPHKGTTFAAPTVARAGSSSSEDLGGPVRSKSPISAIGRALPPSAPTVATAPVAPPAVAASVPTGAPQPYAAPAHVPLAPYPYPYAAPAPGSWPAPSSTFDSSAPAPASAPPQGYGAYPMPPMQHMPYMYPYPYPYPPSYGPPQYPYPPGPSPAAQSHPYPPSLTYPPFYAQTGPGSYGPGTSSIYASAEFGYGDAGRASVDHSMHMSSASQGWGLPTSRSAVFNSANFANSTVASLDREAAYKTQQPLMMDLIQELRRSKEEAQWARQKLAETIVLIGAPVSPVLSASAQNADAAKPQVAPVPTQASAPRRLGNDEVEEDEEEDENEYSDDFEANNENEEAKRVQQEKREPAQKPPTEAFTAAKLSTAPSSGPAWSEQSRYAVMNPLKESLAHSLLASQELFQKQLESLRSRIQATNYFTDKMAERMNQQWDELNQGQNASSASHSVSAAGGPGAAGTSQGPMGMPSTSLPWDSQPYQSSFKPAPSSREIRAGFEEQRVSSTNKLFDLLIQIYPTMSHDEASRLAAKF
ncbi:hypothetical protein B484DRAFT_427320 [Ochromonadaceae sp. CCMP2298]|nr:hypothetical protein B484DRAFT_427320 [Ochromonadaceae sp. CCMP2298]